MSILKLAFKNLWRHKRRTILNIAAVAITLSLLIFIACMFRGRDMNTFTMITKCITGHIQVHEKGYLDEEVRMPLDLNIKNIAETRNIIKSIPEVDAIGTRIKFDGFLSNGREKMPVVCVGIEPEEEKKIWILKDVIKQGSYLSDEGVLIGTGAAKILGLGIGDIIFLYAQTLYNAQNLIELPVTGIFNMGSPEMDKGMVVLTLKDAQTFTDMEDKATEMVVMARKKDSIENVLLAMRTKLPNLDIQDWTFLAKTLLDDLKQDSFFMGLFLFILVILSTFGIVNVISMNVFERRREIGTMRAIGMTRKKIVFLFLVESMLMALIGVIFAWIMGGLLSLYLVKVGLPVSNSSASQLQTTISMAIATGQKIRGSMNIMEYIGVFLLGIGASFIGGCFPAIKASRLKVVTALREAMGGKA